MCLIAPAVSAAPSVVAATARRLGPTAFASLIALATGPLACSGPLPPPPRPSDEVARIEWLEGRTLQRIAFGSCSDQSKAQPVWTAVRDDNPDLYVALGDNIYADTEDVDVLRAKYWRQEAIPGFAALRRTVPVYGTWDDHDYGANDAGAEYPKKDESQRLFLDFLRVAPDSPRRGRRGVYDAVVLGPPGRRVHVIALDLRYHQGPRLRDAKPFGYEADVSPESTMLGAEQWAWFEQELARPAEVRIVLSSIQLVPNYDSGERWGNRPLERERALKALGAAAPSALVVVSGDRHFGELSTLEPGPAGVPLYEMTTSGLTEVERFLGPNPLRSAGPFVTVNYGLIDLNWDAPQPALVMRLRDAGGRDLAEQAVPLPIAPAAP
ncbi:MAG: alkaline phosphatase family protein [Polyangiaceae bacterium]|nr:alkaline phosphatase family protein [Polyangiaceae bacterium]